MIRNYFKIAFRSLYRNKGFTAINILGLVLGISFSAMLYTYVHNELSYDAFHSKADRTYRVVTVDNTRPDKTARYAVTVPPLAPELKNTYPQVSEYVRLFRFSGQVVIDVKGEKFSERSWCAADASFLNVFDFKLIHGNRATALKESFSVVVTESMANKLFGSADVLGRTMDLDGIGSVKVTGVMQDFPSNSHIKVDLIFSDLLVNDEWKAYLNDWTEYDVFAYIVLHEGASIDFLEKEMPSFMKKHGENEKLATTFQPMRDIYLHSGDIEEGIEAERGQLSYVYIFSTMAIFLLLVAAINYINLTTSKAVSRSKEIGVRKVAGAYKTQLVMQFMTETIVLTFIAMALSLAVMDIAMPFFNRITGKDFDITMQTLTDYLPTLAVITLVIGVLAGSYPALYLSKLKPVASLKGKPVDQRSTFSLRNFLVVFQFTVTIVLIVSTLVIGDQMNYVQTKDIGFDKDQLMVIDINSGAVRNQFDAMKNAFAAIPGVQHVAVSSRVPGEWKNIRQVYVHDLANAAVTDSLQSYFMGFDEDMMATYELKLTAGQYFSGNAKADSSSILLNEAAVKAFGLEDPLGKQIRIKTRRGQWTPQVIGVLNDFNFQSLHQKVAPMIIGYRNNHLQPIDYFTLKIAGKAEGVVEQAAAVHARFDPASPIEYHFLSQQLNTFYDKEKKAGMIFQMGGVLSIIVACLGLLGLASYQVERRTKELGIRKVLGANSFGLFMMVSSGFTRQVVVAFVIACPIAYYMMNRWLSAFEYRVSLGVGVFLIAGIVVLFVALATVSYQSIRAAVHSPVDSIRTE